MGEVVDTFNAIGLIIAIGVLLWGFGLPRAARLWTMLLAVALFIVPTVLGMLATSSYLAGGK